MLRLTRSQRLAAQSLDTSPARNPLFLSLAFYDLNETDIPRRSGSLSSR